MIKKINGYDDVYEIDTCGNVYRKGKKMSWCDNGLGYQQIKLLKNGKRHNLYIHRLVWLNFMGDIPEGYEIHHIDHNKKNNNLENLNVVTHSDNIKEAFKKYGHFGFMNRPKSIQPNLL